MGVPLNNVETANEYTPATTLDPQAVFTRLNIDVYNQSIFWQIRVHPTAVAGQGTWLDEVFMGPSSRTIQRRFITGARVRSAVAGKPAMVTLEGVTPGETGEAV
jgi:hypothetical protein